MHTQRFKAIQIPSRSLSLLQSLATSFMKDPAAARVIGTLDQLPPRHRARIGGGADQQYLWFAWEEGSRTRLVTGALSLEHSRERGRPVLEARVYDENGLLEESGEWVRTVDNGWERCHW